MQQPHLFLVYLILDIVNKVDLVFISISYSFIANYILIVLSLTLLSLLLLILLWCIFVIRLAVPQMVRLPIKLHSKISHV